MKIKSILFSLLFGSAMVTRAVTVNPNELTAAVLIQEAGGEKDSRAIAAVLEVIRNRATNSNTTFSNIVVKKYQFECVTRYGIEGIIWRAKKHPKFNEALKLVKENRLSNFTKGATHFYNPSIPAPAWAKHDEFTVQIGGHYFYKVTNKVTNRVGNKVVTAKR